MCKTKNNSLHIYKDIAIVIAFPDNWAKGEKLRDRLLCKYNICYTPYYKVGHAALLIINHINGEVEYFDFGRYFSAPGKGRARSKATDPKLQIPIKAQINDEGKVDNLREIMDYLESIPDATHGYGKTIFSVFYQINRNKAIQWIDEIIAKGSIPYGTFSLTAMNCSRFVARAIMKGTKSKNKKIKIGLPSTIVTVPIGNVVNASSDDVVWTLNNGVYQQRKLNQFDVFKQTLDDIKLSLKKYESHQDKHNHPITTKEPITPHERIPQAAQHLRGLGENTWLHIEKPNNCSDKEYIIESYSDDGGLNYRIKAQLVSGAFDINAPYRFIYDCNRLITTILQNEKKLIFKLICETSK